MSLDLSLAAGVFRSLQQLGHVFALLLAYLNAYSICVIFTKLQFG